MTANKKSLINKTNIILVAIILVLLWFSTCNPFLSNPIEQPKVKSVEEQAAAVRTDSIASEFFVDSVNKIVKLWKSEAQRWENNWDREVLQNRELQDTISSWLNSEVPDTCEQYKKKAILEFNRLVLSSSKKDTACSKTINSYKNIVVQKDAIIKRRNDDWKKLKTNFDTALAQQKILQSAISKLKSKREIYLSVTGLGNEKKIINGYGLGIGYRGKNGTSVEIGALQIGSTINYSLSVKKPLARF